VKTKLVTGIAAGVFLAFGSLTTTFASDTSTNGLASLSLPGVTPEAKPKPAQAARGLQSGIASMYSHRGRTASGAPHRHNAMTAAHRTLPFGTMVRVTHRKTGRSVVVRIIDRGPFIRGRVIDLSPAGARALGFSGLAPVTLAVLGRGT
jgi:rare lipoprotein A